MSFIVSLLKQSMRLGSVFVWLLAIAVGLLLLSGRRTRSWVRAYFVAVFIGFWLLATPAVADWLASLVSGGYVALQRADEARGANTIVVLGGGADTFHVGALTLSDPAIFTVFRVIEAARLYALLNRPTVILMGGVTSKDPKAGAESDAMGAAIVRLGVPPDRIVLESESKNTREQALALKRMFTGMEPRPFVLVTSPTHVPRAMAAFRAVGLNPIASPAALHSDNARGWLPNDNALMITDTVTYDTAAWLYYWSRGWLSR